MSVILLLTAVTSAAPRPAAAASRAEARAIAAEKARADAEARADAAEKKLADAEKKLSWFKLVEDVMARTVSGVLAWAASGCRLVHARAPRVCTSKGCRG